MKAFEECINRGCQWDVWQCENYFVEREEQHVGVQIQGNWQERPSYPENSNKWKAKSVGYKNSWIKEYSAYEEMERKQV